METVLASPLERRDHLSTEHKLFFSKMWLSNRYSKNQSISVIRALSRIFKITIIKTEGSWRPIIIYPTPTSCNSTLAPGRTVELTVSHKFQNHLFKSNIHFYVKGDYFFIKKLCNVLPRNECYIFITPASKSSQAIIMPLNWKYRESKRGLIIIKPLYSSHNTWNAI